MLGETEFVLRAPGRTLRSPARQLADAIAAHGARLARPARTASETVVAGASSTTSR